MPVRTLEKMNEGKHIGHACEGHFRGLVSRALVGTPYSLSRSFPIKLHVNPDVVIIDNNNIVISVFMVAYWNNAHNSESKLYRCRSEYFGVIDSKNTHGANFISNCLVSVVIYGADGGWKETVLDDLHSNCKPCFYLPRSLSVNEANRLTNIAFSAYKPHWESGKTNSREYVEQLTLSKQTLDPAEIKLINTIKNIINSASVNPQPAHFNNSANTQPKSRIPSGQISTRYRQALGFLSLFSDTEIIVYKNRTSRTPFSGKFEDFALKAHFLGLGKIMENNSIGSKILSFQPAKPIRLVRNKPAYAPDLMDFSSWENIPTAHVLKIVNTHRNHTNNPSDVFMGGAFDQCIGNWRDICHELSSFIPGIVKNIKSGNWQAISSILMLSNKITPECWHPANGFSIFFPTWSIAVSAVATIENSRITRSKLLARIQTSPTKQQSDHLAKELIKHSGIVDLLDDAKVYCDALLNKNYTILSSRNQALLLSTENPCSVLKDFYNTLTTNSSHNPLNDSMKEWLLSKFKSFVWHGWPNNRSISVSKVLATGNERRQWQCIGVDHKNKSIIACEVKSITANHWGDKSKEIYDRVRETRLACQNANYRLICIGILDGDIDTAALMELSTGIGYDEIYSINEILGI